MKIYICVIHIAAILLTGCSLYDASAGMDQNTQMRTWNKLSNHQESCIDFIKNRDKFTDCYKTALENDASINFNIDSEVRRFYLQWECIQLPEETEQDKYEACIDNADSILRKEFPGEGY